MKIKESDVADQLHKTQQAQQAASKKYAQMLQDAETFYSGALASFERARAVIYAKIHADYPVLRGVAISVDFMGQLAYNDWGGYGAKSFSSFENLSESLAQSELTKLQNQLEAYRSAMVEIQTKIAVAKHGLEIP